MQNDWKNEGSVNMGLVLLHSQLGFRHIFQAKASAHMLGNISKIHYKYIYIL